MPKKLENVFEFNVAGSEEMYSFYCLGSYEAVICVTTV